MAYKKIREVKSGIYCLIRAVGNKIYVGQAIDLDKRKGMYLRKNCKGQVKLYNSILKYGIEAHEFKILELCNVEQLNERERYYQELYDVTGVQGLNCVLVNANEKRKEYSIEVREKMSKSQTGLKRSEEHKRRISEAQTGMKYSPERCKNISEGQKGKTFRTLIKMSEAKKGKLPSVETRKKMSEAHKGKIRSEEHIRNNIASRIENKKNKPIWQTKK
jgi:group I intron endonuclease